MKPQYVDQALTVSRLRQRSVLLAGLLLAAAALAPVAIAATDAVVDCDRLATDLKSLEVPARELTADDLEHLAATEDNSLVAPLKAELDADLDIETETVPVLRLTPRVESIISEVFDALPIVTPEETLPEGELGDEEPAAETPPIVTLPAAREPVSESGPLPRPAQPLIRLQRQMYRTDI